MISCGDPVLAVRRNQDGSPMVRAATLLWLGVVGWLTLRSAPAMRDSVLRAPWYCVVCGEGGATDVVVNLALFVPFGVLARLYCLSLRRLVPWAFGLTLAIELTQATLLVGRDATLGDVLSNTGGAVLGWLLVVWVVSIAHSPRKARIASLLVLACQATIWLGTGFGMRPSLDGAPPWVGRFGNSGASQAAFEGTIQAVTLAGIPVSMDPLVRLPGPHDSLTLGLVLTRTSSTPPPRPSSIVRLVDGTPRAFIRVSQVRGGMDMEVQMPASALRFRTPSWRFSKAMEIPTGKPWRFDWRWHATTVELVSGPAASPEQSTHLERRISVGLGWALVHPFTWAIDERAEWWTALWLFSWFVLLGWCARLAGRRFAIVLVCAAVMVLIAAGWLTGLPVVIAELLPSLLGLAAGWWVAYATAPRSGEPDGAPRHTR